MEYTVADIGKLSETIRKYAADSVAPNSSTSTNLDDYINLRQISHLIMENSERNNDGSYIIDEDVFESVFDSVSDIIYGVSLSKLASDDIIECAWDDEKNRMTFWIDDEPET